NPAAVGEGCYGYAFYFSPPSLQPGMKYWYDRTVGLQGDRSFDRSRLGIIASILFYPDTSVVAQDPLTIPEWREAFADTGGNGMQSWRNAYQGTSDLLAQFYVKLRGNRGHNGPDALSFRIVGLNTLWAVGGGRYGKKTNGQEAYWRNMNTVYPVDPDTKLVNSEQSGQLVGTPVILPDGGGHAVARIAQNNIGTRNHQRWFVADHSKAAGAEAAYVIYDTSDDGRFWQFCTLDTHAITTEGNTFTVTSPSGDTLRGTVLYPDYPVKFTTGVRDRGSKAITSERNNFIHFSSEDGSFLVVLTLAKKGTAHPSVAAKGAWTKTPAGKVAVGRSIISISGDQISRAP
ncbi:MAG: hypothetical protein H7Y06_04505, partial [Opitutaceae bacterium]|nr:hypothetical protein [Opitutaceae bacterium]